MVLLVHGHEAGEGVAQDRKPVLEGEDPDRNEVSVQPQVDPQLGRVGHLLVLLEGEDLLPGGQQEGPKLGVTSVKPGFEIGDH